MKVKITKLDERYLNYVNATDEEKARVGQVFEAIKFRDERNPDEKYHNMYALNIGNGLWYLPEFCCEVVEEGTINGCDQQVTQNNNCQNNNKILLVEDGSVDIDKLERDGFCVIVYRQGSKPPMLLK